eukprot:2339840-Rhodomonas_salina.4
MYADTRMLRRGQSATTLSQPWASTPASDFYLSKHAIRHCYLCARCKTLSNDKACGPPWACSYGVGTDIAHVVGSDRGRTGGANDTRPARAHHNTARRRRRWPCQSALFLCASDYVTSAIWR